MMVHKGIKHARTGFDDLDFVSLQDCQEQIHNRPGSAVPSGRVRTSSRPTSASLRPGSTGTRGSGGGSRSNASPVESVASAESGDGRVVYRPGSTDSGGQRRPGTASSGGSLRRPSTASLAPGGGRRVCGHGQLRWAFGADRGRGLQQRARARRAVGGR